MSLKYIQFQSPSIRKRIRNYKSQNCQGLPKVFEITKFKLQQLQSRSTSETCVCAQSHLILCDSWDCSLPGSFLLSLEFSRQEYWSGLPFPSQGSSQPRDQTWSPTLQADSLPSEPPGKPSENHNYHVLCQYLLETFLCSSPYNKQARMCYPYFINQDTLVQKGLLLILGHTLGTEIQSRPGWFQNTECFHYMCRPQYLQKLGTPGARDYYKKQGNPYHTKEHIQTEK